MEKYGNLIENINQYHDACLFSYARIKQVGNKWRVLSQKGKNLGTFDSEKAAKKRLKQIEYFKHLDKSHADDKGSVIDLTKAEEFAYSAIVRQMRKKATPKQVRDFLKIYKAEFDRAVKENLKKPEKVALQNALVKFDKLHKIKLDRKLIKNAAISELGDARLVGQYLASIIKFILNRVPPNKRLLFRDKLKQKFAVMNEQEIANKDLPDSAAIAQSITFVKHVLFNHDAQYIREVLNNLVGAL
jgi:hypothetical protein